MLAIIGALCIFFFIIVPVVNAIGNAISYVDTRTPQQKLEDKNARDLALRIAQLESKRKSAAFAVKYPYLLPGIFGIFVLLAADSSPNVNHGNWLIGTVVCVIGFSLLYRELVKITVRQVDAKIAALKQ
jgi:hypothetical protein